MKVFIIVSVQDSGIYKYERTFKNFDSAESWINDMYDKGSYLEFLIKEVDPE